MRRGKEIGRGFMLWQNQKITLSVVCLSHMSGVIGEMVGFGGFKVFTSIISGDRKEFIQRYIKAFKIGPKNQVILVG